MLTTAILAIILLQKILSTREFVIWHDFKYQHRKARVRRRKGRHSEKRESFFSCFGKTVSILKNLKSQYTICNAQLIIHKLWFEKHHKEVNQNLTPLKQDFVRPQIPKWKISARRANASLPSCLGFSSCAAHTTVICRVLQNICCFELHGTWPQQGSR